MISLATGIGQSSFVSVRFFCLVLPNHNLTQFSGTLLAKKYINACTQSTTHVDEFAALCTDVPEELLEQWAARIRAWELDRNQLNPYFNPSSGTTGRAYVVRLLLIIESPGPSELAIRRRLTLEEEEDDDLNAVAAGSEDDSTETKYLLDGLDLEVQQCGFSVLLGLQN